MIGDVVGHGVRAARMGELRNALRAFAIEGHGPGAVLHPRPPRPGNGRAGMVATVLFLISTRNRDDHAGPGRAPAAVPPGADGSVRFLDTGSTLPIGIDERVTADEAALPR